MKKYKGDIFNELYVLRYPEYNKVGFTICMCVGGMYTHSLFNTNNYHILTLKFCAKM